MSEPGPSEIGKKCRNVTDYQSEIPTVHNLRLCSTDWHTGIASIAMKGDIRVITVVDLGNQTLAKARYNTANAKQIPYTTPKLHSNPYLAPSKHHLNILI